jgi:anti-sigma factor RsiW
MNHPTRDELLDFFDKEMPIERQGALAAHVGECHECEEQLKAWQAARHGMASWELPEPHEEQRRTAPHSNRTVASLGTWRRPAAAAALMAAGFALALILAPRWAQNGNRAELAQEIRRHVQEELRAELAKFESKQRLHQEELLTVLDGRLDQLEVQWLVDYADLRRDIETLAIGTQEGLRRLAGGELDVQDLP